MNLKFIDVELRALGLDPLPLNALSPDDGIYSVLLNQYKGKVTATEDFIGNTAETQDTAFEKCLAFSNVAHANSYDLAVCPEYSMPWRVISSIIDSRILPRKGQLWIYGTESIKPFELRKLIETKTDICWLYDKELLEEEHEKKFLDPVCYLFKATKLGEEIDVCAIQFKNQHMSVHNDIYREEDHLIEGRFLYVHRNPGNTINLVTMICSDSLKFAHKSFLDLNLDKLLVVHIQLNMFPRHDAFKLYRNAIFTAESNQIEVLCLNWARGSTILDSKIPFSGSAYYIKSEKPVLDDDRLNQNQDNGLYYCYWNEKRCHSFFFSSEEYLISFKTSKASQALVAAVQLRRREGPVGSGNFVWEKIYKKTNPIPDRFKNHCTGLSCDLSPLDGLGHVNKERLIKLSNGKNLTRNWHNVQYFDFFSITDTEIINRITFIDEIHSSAQTSRTNNLMNLKELILLFKNDTNIPSQLSALSKDSKIYYNKTNPFVNIYSTDSTNPLGTISYLGTSLPALAKEEFDNLMKLYLDSFSPEQKGRKKPNILFWYVDGGELKSVFSDNTSIDSDFNEYGTAIDKDI